MDNQQNNQNQTNQLPVNQEPVNQEQSFSETPPVLETPVEPVPETSMAEETEDEEFSQKTETEYKPEQPETPQSEPAEETESDSVDAAAAKYQQILDEYTASKERSEQKIQLEPEQPLPEPELKPQLDIETENEYQTPVNEQAPAYDIKTEDSVGYAPVEIEEPKRGNLLKIIFTISLIIFILVLSFLILVYFKTNQDKDIQKIPEISPTPESSITCPLNGIIYKVNESFPSEDGCNTCSCIETGEIVCTEKACDITPTKAATKSATKVTVTPTKAATKSATKVTVVPTKTTTSSAKKVVPAVIE